MTGAEATAMLAALGPEMAGGTAAAGAAGAGLAGLGGGTAALFGPELGFGATMLGASEAPLAGMAPMFTGAAGSTFLSPLTGATFGMAGLPASEAVAQAGLGGTGTDWMGLLGKAGKVGSVAKDLGVGQEQQPQNVKTSGQPDMTQGGQPGLLQILQKRTGGLGQKMPMNLASGLAVQARLSGMSPEELMQRILKGQA